MVTSAKWQGRPRQPRPLLGPLNIRHHRGIILFLEIVLSPILKSPAGHHNLFRRITFNYTFALALDQLVFTITRLKILLDFTTNDEFWVLRLILANIDTHSNLKSMQ